MKDFNADEFPRNLNDQEIEILSQPQNVFEFKIRQDEWPKEFDQNRNKKTD